ncbi:Uma2 family endonuclease [Kitasatospora sp. MAP12-15]|uniref:Uma2 family endonuclease n=1 Tax=unclassified Kitasatospora TaxID=2633591 RepID=UPI002473BBE8|nr:Uma2 family endonuclease [Kitasatospora sp. MAP12-44]MDH6113351.1 Uma2 family endonuclease [Kitasatospora sp. MAP12-44]
MSVVAFGQWTLPDSPYAMWARGELADYLRLPDDGTRVEVVGGEFVVSPAPGFPHGGIVATIQRAIDGRGFVDPVFPWRTMQVLGLDLVEIGDGYIPDLLVFHADVEARGWSEGLRFLRPDQVELVVEVTSKSNAQNDRGPVFGRRQQATKWSGYARARVPYYLLVDRDPGRPGVTLFGEPDHLAGTYRTLSAWKFGDVVALPEPFGIEIPTELWRPWSD